jgi:hypothetical protein
MLRNLSLFFSALFSIGLFLVADKFFIGNIL